MTAARSFSAVARRTSIAVGLLALLAACSDDGTNPPPAAAGMVIVSGNNQTGIVETVLGQPLVVHVEDGAGDDLEGATVNWTVVTGGGAVANASTLTGSNGRTGTQLTLGPDPGTNEVRASVDGTTLEVTFSATGQEPPPDLTPATLIIVAGNNQTAGAGATLPDSLRVQVRNAAGTALTNIQVTWAVTEGGGSVASATTTTNEDGVAANAWTLGSAAGANRATATVVGTGTITVTFTATATTGAAGSEDGRGR